MTTKKLVFIYGLNQTFHWFMIGLIIPVMTLLQLEKGLDLFQIGIVGAVWGITVMLLELPTGGLADAIGRKRVYLISLVMLFCGGLVLLIAWNFTTVAFGFCLAAVARALSSGSMDAWFVDEFNKIEPDGNLQEALAKVGIWIPAGLGIGAFVGGLLPMSLGNITAQIPGFGIYSANLIVIMLLVLIQFVLTSVLVQEHLAPDRKAGMWSGLQQFPDVVSASVQYGLKHRVIRLLLLSSVGFAVGLHGLEMLWQPQVKQILGSDSQTWVFGLLSAGYFFTCSLGAVFSMSLCKVFNNDYPRVLLYTRLFIGVCYCALALQGNLFGFTAIYWILFAGNGMSNSPYLAMFNAHVPEAQRSTLLSLQSFAEQLGGLIGAVGLGYLANTLSIPVAWLFAAEILVISSLAYVLLAKKQPANQQAEAVSVPVFS